MFDNVENSGLPFSIHKTDIFSKNGNLIPLASFFCIDINRLSIRGGLVFNKITENVGLYIFDNVEESMAYLSAYGFCEGYMDAVDCIDMLFSVDINPAVEYRYKSLSFDTGTIQ